MSKLYTITAYSNTGFDAVNIPHSPAILAQAGTAKVYPSVYLRQPWGRTSFRIDSTWADVQNIDYITATDPATGDMTCYTVDGITMISDNTAEIAISMDPITTAGGINAISILDGWCKRRHFATSEDELFANIIPEPWAPSQALVLDAGGPVSDVDDIASVVDTKNIAGATIALDGDFDTALTYTDGTHEVTAPITPIPQNAPTQFRIYFTDPDNPGSGRLLANIIPELYAYDMDQNDIRDGINKARSLGLEQAIVASYAIPTVYIDETQTFTDHPYQYSRLTAVTAITRRHSPDYVYGTNTARNKKAYSLYNKYRLSSPASGDYMEFDASDIYHSGDTQPAFITTADLAPGGCPYARPQYYHGLDGTTPARYMMAVVRGGEWLNTPITFNGASGAAWTTAAYNRQQASIIDQSVYAAQSAGLSGIGSLLNAIPGFNLLSSTTPTYQQNPFAENFGSQTGTAKAYSSEMSMPSIGGIGGAITGLIGSGMAIAQTEKTGTRAAEAAASDYNRAIGVVTPQVTFPMGNNIQNYVGNGFWISRTRLSEADLDRLDSWFDRYGYAVDEKLDISAFSTRSKCNYVEAASVSVNNTTNNMPLRMRNAIASQIERGVRVWHVKPDPSAYTTNT